MSQHDYNIANQGFPNFRSDLNNALSAIATNNSGSTAPTTTFAHQWWLDTSTTPNTLRIRNADNDAWVVIGTVDQSTDKFKLTPADGISTDTISELTSAAGVTIDSVLLKDGGVTVSDGTVSAPTVTNTGDTNTGIYFPAADEVAVAAGGSVAAAFNSHQFMGMRNRIINGDMRIDQRNAGASVTISDGTGTYTLDRYRIFENTDGVITVQQSTTAPTGFTNSLLVTVTTADTSIAAGQLAIVEQKIEGFNVADLAWGTANAKTVTLSFWVRSNLTGTFGGSLRNSADNRSYPFSYTINSANTFEQKTVTIAGDTTGTWVTNNGVGLQVTFGLAVGSTYLGTAGSWSGSNLQSATGQTNLFATVSNTWYITGVQLEVGSTATPFERRPYGTELMLCQRYCNVYSGAANATFATGMAYSTTALLALLQIPVEMRAAPTAAYSSATDFKCFNNVAGDVTLSTVGYDRAQTKGILITGTVASGLTAGNATVVNAVNTSAKITLSAEL